MKNFIVVLSVILLFTFVGCKLSRPDSSSETPVSVVDADSAEPAIAADSEGNIYVLFVEHGAGKAADVFLQKFGNDTKPIGEKVRVNPKAGQATAWRGDPPTIKIGSEGTIYVGWTARVEVSKGVATDLYLSVSNDGGKSFLAPVKVNDDKLPASHGMHSLEVDKSGHIYVAWLDERYLKDAAPPQTQQKPVQMKQMDHNSSEMKDQDSEPNSEVYFAVSRDNGNSFSANRKIAGNICPCCKTTMATAPDGRLYISWRQVLEGDFRHIAVSSSIDGGNSFSPSAIVSNDEWQIAGCPVSGAAMTVDNDNSLKIIWYTAGKAGMPGIYQAESKDGGKSFSTRKMVTDKIPDGTPLMVQDDQNGNSQIVFSGADKNTYFIATQNNTFMEQNKINDADLPSAAITKDKVFIVFVRKLGEKRNILLLKQNKFN